MANTSYEALYVKLAENIVDSYRSLVAAAGTLGEGTTTISGVTKPNALKNIVDVTSSFFSDAAPYLDSNIDAVKFEIATLSIFNNVYLSIQNMANSANGYTPAVKALNDFTINNVLGQYGYTTTTNNVTTAMSLSHFVNTACTSWNDPSTGVPAEWITLCAAAGYTI